MRIVFAAFLVVLVSFGEARRRCKCSSATHPQQYFCRSDFFFRGRLLAGPTKEAIPEPKHPESSFRIWETERRVLSYVFRVNEILKGHRKGGKDGWTLQRGKKSKSHSAFNIKVYTDPHTCTVKMSSKTTYAIGGYIDEGRMFVSSCNFVRPWYSLNKSQKLGFRRIYKDNCHCRVCSSLDTNGELLDKYCSQKHLYCGKEGPASCQWKHVTKNYIPYNQCVFMNLFGLYFKDFALFQTD